PRASPRAEGPLDLGPGGLQRRGQLVGLAAAGLRHVVAAAATTADDLRRHLDDVARLHAALDRAGGRRHEQARLALGARAKDDHAGIAELVLHPVRDVWQRLRRRAVAQLERGAHAVELDDGGELVVHCRRGLRALEQLAALLLV